MSGERDCCPLKGTAAVETRAGIVAAAEGRHTGDMVFAGDVGDHEARARRASDGQACGNRDLSGDAASRLRGIVARRCQHRTEPRRRFLQSIEYRQWAGKPITVLNLGVAPPMTLGAAAARQV